jgi:hypothetical protein
VCLLDSLLDVGSSTERPDGSSYLIVMKTSGALSEIIAAPLLAYGAVFRTLIVLQAQTRGTVRV